MDTDLIITKVREALNEVFENEYALFEKNVSERCICQNLAYYLKLKFPESSVDCEYNRCGSGTTIMKKTPDGPVSEKGIFTDIIIHKRGTNEENIAAFEVKYTDRQKSGFASDAERLCKLTAFNGYYHYQLGFQVILPKKNHVADGMKVTVFRNGEEKGTL